MDSLVLLSVLAITQTTVSARSVDMDFKTKRSVDPDSSEIFKPEFIKFPTDIRHGFTVTINGTLDTKKKQFEVVFPTANKEKDSCRITYDFVSNNIDVSPSPPEEVNISEYNICKNLDNPGEYPTFSIKIRARSMDHNSMLKFTFEANGCGETPLMTCPIKSFDDFGYVEFRNGVYNITTLVFEF